MNSLLTANDSPNIFFVQDSAATRTRAFLYMKFVGKAKVTKCMHVGTLTVAAAFQDTPPVGQSASITPENAVEFDRDACYKNPVQKPFPIVSLDGDGYLRLNDVLTVYPVSRAAWYDGVQKGIYPAAVKLGRRSVGWSRAAIRELIANPPTF